MTVRDGSEPLRIAVIGAGVSGAACAAGLLRAGFDVTAFDKSREVGGRMATRRVEWAGDDDVARSAVFDHGCDGFSVTGPRFRAVVDRGVASGVAARWRRWVHAPFPTPAHREVVAPLPDMPAFCRHLLQGVPLRLGQAVTALERSCAGWMLHRADGGAEGPFDRVVVAVPPAQAAPLLVGHRDVWAEALAADRMSSCWTLMALTDDLDWPWDAAEIDRGELAWIARQDRGPRRTRAAFVPWVAHASPAWSLAHLEDDPADVRETLCAALGKLLNGDAVLRWHHASVHRWRHARRVDAASGDADHWYCAATGLGVCGDALGDGSVEGAWCSGDNLARLLVEVLGTRPADVAETRAGAGRPASPGRARRPATAVALSRPPAGNARWSPPDAARDDPASTGSGDLVSIR